MRINHAHATVYVLVGGGYRLRQSAAVQGNVSTGGNTFLSEKHALLPRLGLFKDQPQDIPYDYAELIAAIAPRPVLLVSPSGDRFTMPAAVSSAAAEAQKAWTTRGAPSNFFFASPDR